MASFLVTGGAGFIGSHIVDRLTREEHRVRVLDNFFAGTMANIQHNMDKIDLIRGDIRDVETVRRAVDGIDYVLHQAAMRSVPMSVENPRPYNDVNITGTLNLLLACREAGVKRVVFASSSSVYGNNPVLPKREDMLPDPISPYAVTKLAGEAYCHQFTLYGLETVSLRYFNVFGPRQDTSSQYAVVIPKFIAAVLEDRRPVIYGDGLQSRDFTYVRNNVEANLKACLAPSEVAGDVFNVAYGERYTLLQVLEAINGFLGKSIEPIFEPPRLGDVLHTQGDGSKARKMLDYTPSTGFIEGLEEMARWMADNRR